VAKLPELNSLIHGKIRLSVLSILAGAEAVQFTLLRDKIGTTDGNLSVHLTKLEKADCIISTKKFVNKKPMTTYRITEKGRKEFLTYIKNLKKILANEI
jgi:DNA-binding MarR family transcriptional regulator